jgi:hypothetical protein
MATNRDGTEWLGMWHAREGAAWKQHITENTREEDVTR